MAIFAYVQHINDAYIVGGSENVEKPTYVIFEWSLCKNENFIKNWKFSAKMDFNPLCMGSVVIYVEKKRLHLNVKEVPPLFYCCELS